LNDRLITSQLYLTQIVFRQRIILLQDCSISEILNYSIFAISRRELIFPLRTLYVDYHYLFYIIPSYILIGFAIPQSYLPLVGHDKLVIITQYAVNNNVKTVVDLN